MSTGRRIGASRDWTTPALAFVAGLAFLISLAVFIVSWNQPILDIHAFRQTQTAISVWALAEGGPLLGYETPVLGYPWAIPFEFPLFQWLVALVHVATGLPIDPAGRIVSWLFFLGTLALIDRLVRRLGGDARLSLISCSLLLLSPLYLFWSRAFMIESMALFFSVLFLLGLVGFLQRGGAIFLVWMLVGALAASLVKITTFVGFALAGGGITVAFMVAAYRRNLGVAGVIRVAIVPTIVMALTLGVLEAWLVYSDDLKLANPIATGRLTSGALQSWNFGSVAQRLDWKNWSDIFFGRALQDTFGWAAIFWIALVGLVALRKYTWIAVALAALYIAPFLIFTNLHFVHNYYQYANAIFALALLALLVWNLIQIDWAPAGLALLAVALVVGLVDFRQAFWPALAADYALNPTLVVAAELRQTTKPDDVIFIFGMDWSSQLAYYAERRAVTVPGWIDPALVTGDRGIALAGGNPIGAVVDCSGAPSSKFSEAIGTLTAGRMATQVGPCSIYR